MPLLRSWSLWRSILPILAAGHRETMADLLEIRATNFVLGTKEPGVAFTDEDRDHLWKLYDGILTLDPNDADAGLRGAILMGAFGNRADDCVALAKRTLGEPGVEERLLELQILNKQLHIGIMPHPAMPVTPTDSGGLNPDDNSSGSRAGVGDGLNSEGAVKFPEEGSGHGADERRGMSPGIPAFTSRRESSFGTTQSEQRL